MLDFLVARLHSPAKRARTTAADYAITTRNRLARQLGQLKTHSGNKDAKSCFAPAWKCPGLQVIDGKGYAGYPD